MNALYNGGCLLRLLRFHIPPQKRKPIVFLLCGNAFCQYATQLCRFYWSSFDDSQTVVGAIFINVTFVGGILCGIVSGSLQGNAEGGVRKAHPGEFPPTPMEIAIEAWKAERARIREEMRGHAAEPAAPPQKQGSSVKASSVKASDVKATASGPEGAAAPPAVKAGGRAQYAATEGPVANETPASPERMSNTQLRVSDSV